MSLTHDEQPLAEKLKKLEEVQLDIETAVKVHEEALKRYHIVQAAHNAAMNALHNLDTLLEQSHEEVCNCGLKTAGLLEQEKHLSDLV